MPNHRPINLAYIGLVRFEDFTLQHFEVDSKRKMRKCCSGFASPCKIHQEPSIKDPIMPRAIRLTREIKRESLNGVFILGFELPHWIFSDRTWWSWMILSLTWALGAR